MLGPQFRLEDAAEMLGKTPATLLPGVQEAMDAAIVAAAHSAFAFRHELLRRAIGETIPRPARKALHRQYGEILLARDESAERVAVHLLQAAHPADRGSLATLDQAAARTRRSAPQVAAGLAVRALQLTAPADPAARPRGVAAAEALAAAGHWIRPPGSPATCWPGRCRRRPKGRLRCALSCVLSARGQARDAADQAQLAASPPGLRGDLRDQVLTARLQALTGLRDELASQLADRVLADPGQHDGHVVAAALAACAMLAWDRGQPGAALGLLRDAARPGSASSPDARQVQPLLLLAAALVDLRQLGEAEDILSAADDPALHGIPARAGLSILRARVELAAGRLAGAAEAARAALAIARELGADGYAATASRVLGMIELRRGDIAAAAEHLAGYPPTAHSSRTSTRGPRASWPRLRSARRAMARRPPSAASASSAPTSRPGPASCSATRRPPPGWRAPPWPPATASWPPARPVPPARWRMPTPSSRPGRRRRAQPRPGRPRPGRTGAGHRAASRSVGPRPRRRKTWASGTASKATGSGPSAT